MLLINVASKLQLAYVCFGFHPFFQQPLLISLQKRAETLDYCGFNTCPSSGHGRIMLQGWGSCATGRGIKGFRKGLKVSQIWNWNLSACGRTLWWMCWEKAILIYSGFLMFSPWSFHPPLWFFKLFISHPIIGYPDDLSPLTCKNMIKLSQTVPPSGKGLDGSWGRCLKCLGNSQAWTNQKTESPKKLGRLPDSQLYKGESWNITDNPIPKKFLSQEDTSKHLQVHKTEVFTDSPAIKVKASWNALAVDSSKTWSFVGHW